MSECRIYVGDNRIVLPKLEAESVDCVVTSPPYFQMRDYGCENQIGNEDTWQKYISNLVCVFHELKRVLKSTGTLWLNIGDKYSGSHNGMGKNGGDRKWIGRNCENKLATDWSKCTIPERNLMGIPWRLAFAMQEDGWILRQDIIWHKPNVIPCGGKNPNKCTSSYEHLFLFTKVPTGYYWNAENMVEPSVCSQWLSIGGKKYPGKIENASYSGNVPRVNQTRRMRDVWSIPTQPYSGAHFACFPEALCKRCIMTGSPKKKCNYGLFFRQRYCWKGCC